MSTKLAWAAGFFDGEGWSGTARRPSPRPILRSSIGQYGLSRPDVLTRFHEAVGGVGHITGPYGRDGRVYSWHASKGATIDALTLLWPWLGPVKRAQFQAALRRCSLTDWSEPREQPPSADELDAWCAGLFDGEGWVGTTECGSAGRRRLVASMTQASDTGTPEVLRRMSAVLGGWLYGPDCRPPRIPRYCWRVNGEDVATLAMRLRPWLSAPKRRQFELALALYDKQAARVWRGRRGPRKSLCIRGHDYSEVRTYLAMRPDGEVYFKRYCTPCDRVRKARRNSPASAP